MGSLDAFLDYFGHCSSLFLLSFFSSSLDENCHVMLLPPHANAILSLLSHLRFDCIKDIVSGAHSPLLHGAHP